MSIPESFWEFVEKQEQDKGKGKENTKTYFIIKHNFFCEWNFLTNWIDFLCYFKYTSPCVKYPETSFFYAESFVFTPSDREHWEVIENRHLIQSLKGSLAYKYGGL